jgi:hypothetical protein
MKHKKSKKIHGSLKQKRKSIRKKNTSQKKINSRTQKKISTDIREPVQMPISLQSNDNKSCCICMQPIENKFFNPSKCLQEHGSRAHRICVECWWGDFAKEGSNHLCPGCEKNIPLPPKNTEKSKPGATIILLDE